MTPAGYQSGGLSYGQQALWFLHRLAPTSTAYNVVFATRVLSATSEELLRVSVQRLVHRHAMLRTVYTSEQGTPVQHVLPPHDIVVETIACPTTASVAIRQRLADEAYRPFDLERAVFRPAIFITPDRERFLLLAAHHIAVDFQSIALMLQDLGEYHRAARTGEEPSLRPTEVEYSDYVRWQAELLEGADGARLWRYWRDQLAPALPATRLPVDHDRPAVDGFQCATVTLETGTTIAERLARIARESEATLSTAILAAFQIVLREWTGQDDVLVGYVTPGRKPEFAHVVGYFVNPVVVRTRFEAGLRFRDLLRRVQSTVDAACAHQDFPFSLLVERLHPHREVGTSPLFQVLFAMYDLDAKSTLPLLVGTEGGRVEVGDLQLESVPIEHRGAMLDVSLIVVRTAGNLTAYLQCNAELFSRETMRHVADRFRAVLSDVTADTLLVGQASAGLSPEVRPRTTQAVVTEAHLLPPTMAFSLFFFASDDASAGPQKYRLLLEAARFADRHGFSAVWTPERHFHPFGGIYPNPAVTGAAVAAVTTRLQIRAGSVVLPLHHPARVAEEWSVVDNISNGRVAVSFASGWHANDFVFAPANYADRREIMAREIETVRKLWRGEAVTYIGGDGRPVDVTIWPRPVQGELPIWVTAFGNPETFRLAGELGAGLLTHLLGQSIKDLAAKITVYRDARRAHGFDPASGRIAVMLHTFVGDDVEAVRQTVRVPFLEYLRTSVDLAKVGEQAGLPADGEHYQKANVDAFLEATFNRYFATNTLFGTPDTCAPLVQALGDAGVTEIACLVDFGIDTDRVLAGLEGLERLRAACCFAPSPPRLSRDSAADAHRAVLGVKDRVQMRRQSMDRYPRAHRTPESRDRHSPGGGQT